MTISANLVKDLRERTGAGMMDCKKALLETNGNFDEAIDWLRKKGLAAAAKKAGRVTAEGLVAAIVHGEVGVVLELNSETDFVAKNDKFQTLAKGMATEFMKFSGSFEEFMDAKFADSGKTVSELISENISIIGENLSLRRAKKITVKKGVVCNYVHNQAAPSLGKIGVIVGLESDASADKLMQVGKQIAMHIAAAKPDSLSVSDLDPALVAKEREIFSDQARASGKPDAVIAKMVEGRIAKYYEQAVLLEQVFVVDGKTKISEVLNNAAKELGHPITITGYIKYELGEGIEKKHVDFAKEVAETLGT